MIQALYRDSQTRMGGLALSGFGGHFAGSVVRYDLSAVANLDRHFKRLTVAQYLQVNGSAGLRCRDRLHQLVAIRHRAAIDPDDDVGRQHSSLGGRAAGSYLLHEHAARCAISLQQRGILLAAKLYADRAARYFAVLHDLVIGVDCQVDGQGEADAFKVAAAAGDHGIDADDFAVDVEQRAAAIAAVDGCVSLQEALHLMAGIAEIAPLRADDAGGHSLFETERRANGHGPVADSQWHRSCRF